MVGKLLNAGQTCIAPDYVLVPAGPRAGIPGRGARGGGEVLSRRWRTTRTTPRSSMTGHYQRLQGYLPTRRRVARNRAAVDGDRRMKGGASCRALPC